MQIELGNPEGLVLFALAPVFVWLARRSLRGMRPQRARWALATRLGVLALLALALADPRLKTAADKLAVAFLVDVSDSVGSQARGEAEKWIQDALKEMPAGDEAAVVAFAGDALVERTTSPIQELQPIRSDPAPNATDLA